MSLSTAAFGRASAQIERLEQRGVLLTEPHSRQLRGKLRELRFTLDGRSVRITYFVAPGRRIILLTVFEKEQRQERRQIERAARRMAEWVAKHPEIDT